MKKEKINEEEIANNQELEEQTLEKPKIIIPQVASNKPKSPFANMNHFGNNRANNMNNNRQRPGRAASRGR